MEATIQDLTIAKGIVKRAHEKGKISRASYLRGDMFLTREINIRSQILGTVKRGARIEKP